MAIDREGQSLPGRKLHRAADVVDRPQDDGVGSVGLVKHMIDRERDRLIRRGIEVDSVGGLYHREDFNVVFFDQIRLCVNSAKHILLPSRPRSGSGDARVRLAPRLFVRTTYTGL